MKCDNCGGNLSLEDAFCPHCGKPNQHAAQHIKDMKHYKGEFEDTKQDVYQTTRAYTETTVRVVIAAVLIILIVASFVLAALSYDIKRDFARSKADKNFSKYSKLLDGYLEEENYQEFNAFVNEHQISTYDNKYEQYFAVRRAAQAYATVYEYMMQVATPPKYVEDLTDSIERMTTQLEYFYDVVNSENYEEYEGSDAELYVTSIENMEKNVQALLVTYIHMTPEDAAQMKTMTNAKRAYLIEESLDNEQ